MVSATVASSRYSSFCMKAKKTGLWLPLREVKTKTEDCGEELDGYWSVGYQGASECEPGTNGGDGSSASLPVLIVRAAALRQSKVSVAAAADNTVQTGSIRKPGRGRRMSTLSRHGLGLARVCCSCSCRLLQNKHAIRQHSREIWRHLLSRWAFRASYKLRLRVYMIEV